MEFAVLKGQGRFDVRGKDTETSDERGCRSRWLHRIAVSTKDWSTTIIATALFCRIGARLRRNSCALVMKLLKSMDSIVMFPCPAHGAFAVMLNDMFMAFLELGLPFIRPHTSHTNTLHELKSNSRSAMLGRCVTCTQKCWLCQPPKCMKSLATDLRTESAMLRKLVQTKTAVTIC